MKARILTCVFLLPLLLSCGGGRDMSENGEREKLLEILGAMPQRPELETRYLDTLAVEGGVRYKIKYLAEQADPESGFPEDWVYAYLFVPEHAEGEKLPVMIAVHQDDISFHLGKDEAAGYAGKESMQYGRHLFERGYVVLCPDRYYHAERRSFDKTPWYTFDEPDYDRDNSLMDNRVGALMLKGGNHYSKEAYDLSRAVDFVYTLPYADTERIGAIGHSAGGVAVGHGMFYDERIALAVSSCGLYDIARLYKYETPVPFPALMSMPGLIKEGYTTADFMRHIYPRSLIITRGANEWGEGDLNSVKFVAEAYAFADAYNSAGEDGDVTVIIFEEGGGEHDFPPGVRSQVYGLIDQKFKR